MLIEAIEVKNFRCLREAKMDCSNLTAIIGRNGAGKSTFLYALDTFYDIGANITAEDFFDRDTESTIEIRVTYSNLREDEKEEFKSYIRDNKLIVTKRISCVKDIVEFKQEFEEKIAKLYSSDNLTELPELGEAISKILDVFAPGAKLLLRLMYITKYEVLLQKNSATTNRVKLSKISTEQQD